MRPLLLILSVLLLPIFLLSFISAGTASAQKEPASHLLWYKGRKIRPNVLLASNGDTVKFNPANATVRVANESRQLDKMLLELNKTPQRVEEMMKKLTVSVPGAGLPSYGFQIRTSFIDVQNLYKKALSNTLTIPTVKIASAQYAAGKAAVMKPGSNDVELSLHNAVLELEDHLMKHRNDPLPSLPVPPQNDYMYCGDCEATKQKEYMLEVDAFIVEVISEEKALLDRAMSISRRAYSLLSDRSNSFIQTRLGDVINMTMQRLQKKVNFLVLEYIDQADYCEAVANLALRTDRQMQLLGLETDANISSAFERSCTTLTGMINLAIEENDYSVARNMNLVFSTVRKYQLLGKEMPGNIFEKALAFNKDESYKTR